jgi:arylsulfatase A-like enzyme
MHGVNGVRRPNFIFILIDDMGWRDLGCYGSTFYETPNLDRLAAEGVQFTNAYAACPVCSPTRASILAGRYPARVGVTDFIGGRSRGRLISAPYIDHLPLEEFNLARALKAAGYATWHVGKWHLGGEPYWPEKQGFDVNVGGCSWGMPMKGYFSPWGNPRLADGPEGQYLTDRLTDEAIRLIRENDGTPFFLNLWHYAVHIPIQVKPADAAKYEKKARDLGLDKIDPFIVGEAFPCEHKKDKRVIRRTIQSDPAYAAMVENLDWNVGRVLGALDDAGLVDDTVVVFTSDNGGLATAEGSPTSNAPLAEGKGWMYEGGTREPLLIRWPGRIMSGSLCDVPVTSPDFYPTILEMAGLSPRPEQHCDGESFWPVLEGSGALRREGIFCHYPHYGNQGGAPGCSVRCGDYKLIEFFEDNHVELYNLREDCGEQVDLAPAEPAVREQLRGMLHEWLASVEARIPQANPDYAPWEGRGTGSHFC